MQELQDSPLATDQASDLKTEVHLLVIKACHYSLELQFQTMTARFNFFIKSVDGHSLGLFRALSELSLQTLTIEG